MVKSVMPRKIIVNPSRLFDIVYKQNPLHTYQEREVWFMLIKTNKAMCRQPLLAMNYDTSCLLLGMR